MSIPGINPFGKPIEEIARNFANNTATGNIRGVESHSKQIVNNELSDLAKQAALDVIARTKNPAMFGGGMCEILSCSAPESLSAVTAKDASNGLLDNALGFFASLSLTRTPEPSSQAAFVKPAGPKR